MERIKRESSLDLEAMEFYVRSAMLQAGARVVEQVLSEVGRGRRAQPLLCANNHLVCRMESIGLREKTIRTILGEVRFKRSAYRCPVCGATRYPGDESLDVAGTGFSPGVRRMTAYAGGDTSGFRLAGKALELCAALRLDPKDIERVSEETGRIIEDWAARERSVAVAAPPPEETPDTLYVTYDATGAPIRKEELREVKGKGEDGKAKTRETCPAMPEILLPLSFDYYWSADETEWATDVMFKSGGLLDEVVSIFCPARHDRLGQPFRDALFWQREHFVEGESQRQECAGDSQRLSAAARRGSGETPDQPQLGEDVQQERERASD